MAGQTKLGRFLKKKGSSQNEAAEMLGMAKSTFSLKANGFTEEEKNKLARHYQMTSEEAAEIFG